MNKKVDAAWVFPVHFQGKDGSTFFGPPMGLNGRRNHHGGSSGVCFDAIVPMDLIISPWVNLLVFI